MLGALVVTLAGCGVLYFIVQRTDIGTDPFLERVSYYTGDSYSVGLASCNYASQIGGPSFLSELSRFERRAKDNVVVVDGTVDVVVSQILVSMSQVCPDLISEISQGAGN